MPRAAFDPVDEINIDDVVQDTRTGPIAIPTPPTGDLRWWADHEWTGGVEIEQLAGLESFAIRTMNNVYTVTVLSPQAGEALVRGGRFFAEPTRCEIAGCSRGGSCLKVHAIYPGFCLELLRDGERIVTSAVQSIARVDRDNRAVV